MAVLVAASAALTCLGDAETTFAALVDGRHGSGPLRYVETSPGRGAVAVTHGYHIDDEARERPLRPSAWLAACVRDALDRAELPASARVTAIVGTGLRELRAVERWAIDGAELAPERLHFGRAVTEVAPVVDRVLTVANACSAGGHALALAQDLIELGDVDAVVVGAADAMTHSMLAMIGRVSEEPTVRVRPFDRDRTGVLLGEGAAAVVLVGEGSCAAPEARLLATGLSCDAAHETAPDVEGIAHAMRDAFERSGRAPSDVDLIIAHGTGTALNDPTETAALRRIFGDRAPAVTALKGAIGHTSGASALHSLVVATQCLRTGLVPPVAGLRTPMPEAPRGLVRPGAPPADPIIGPRSVIQIDAFGFGGVNSVSLVEGA